MKKIALFLGLAILISAWQLIDAPKSGVQGKVFDQETGEVLIGASVLIKGTHQGTVTDVEGNFKLDFSGPCTTLLISYTGYTTQEVKACPGDQLTVHLSGAITLDEVVVTGQNVPKKTKEVTGSQTIINNSPPKIKIRKEREQKKQAKESNARYDNLMYSNKPMNAASSPSIMPMMRQKDDVVIHNTEDYSHITENRFFEATQTPVSTFSIDVDAASYSNMRRFINNGQQPPIDAVRIEEMVNYFNYEYPQPKDDHPFTVITEISECPWQEGHRLLHVGMQGKEIPTENLPASNLVFLIDVSGSMSAANKLPLLQTSFKMLTDQLRPQDKVALVVYAGAAGLVLPPTAGNKKQQIKAAIDQLQAGGSTAGGAGIQLAYNTARENFVEGGNNRVILATDGDFNVGPSSDSELVKMIEKERESGVFLTVLGFGTGNYKDNKMQELANKGNGNHGYIDNIREAQKVLVNEFGETMFTIAKDVKIQIEFNPANVKAYRLIGYENRMLEKEDFNDDKKDAGELGAGHTVTALYEIIPAGVESPHIAGVDKLKYQKVTEVKPKGDFSDELMTIKLRYKKPDGLKSILMESPVLDRHTKINQSSGNFRWSASVAQFGMLLRNSEYKGNANYADAIRLAEKAKGPDLNGYRKEMIEMMRVMKSIADPDVAGK